MERIFIILLLSLIPGQAISQNYRTLVVGDTCFYNFNVDGFSIYPWNNVSLETSVFIDSTGTVPGGFSFYNYRRFDYFNDPSGWCDSSTRIGWLGSHSIQFPNGMDVFITEAADSIFINTQAGQGAFWRMFTYPNGDYLRATVSSVSSYSFLGITDSVKTITLQTKNQGSANILQKAP